MIYPDVPGYSPYADVREAEADGTDRAPMPMHCPDPADKLGCLRELGAAHASESGYPFDRAALPNSSPHRGATGRAR